GSAPPSCSAPVPGPPRAAAPGPRPDTACASASDARHCPSTAPFVCGWWTSRNAITPQGLKPLQFPTSGRTPSVSEAGRQIESPVRLLRNVRISRRGQAASFRKRSGVFLAQQHGPPRHGVPEVCDTPAARARDLSEEPAEVQPFEEAGDLGAAPAIVGDARAEEATAQLAVPEALQQVFARRRRAPRG